MGLEPTPETIRQGTVRMEEHPRYAQTLVDIEARGYHVITIEGDPAVVVCEVIDAQGNILRTEHEVWIRPGMPFLDLEHEVGHLDQIQYRLQDAMLPTQRVLENGKPSSNRLNLYAEWMNTVSEYHNRLVEYKRLFERNVEVGVLETHAQGVRLWREEYQKIVRTAQYGSAKGAQRIAWARTYFPDIAALETNYEQAGGRELERDLRA